MSEITPEMLLGPAGYPPSGVAPLRPNPPNNGDVLIKLSSALMVLMALFLANRIYVKAFVKKSWGWDDVTCAISVLFTIFFFVIGVQGVNECHIGVHQYDITLGQFLETKCIINFFLSDTMVAPAFLFMKLTFFILFLQIFWPIRWLRIANWLGIGVNVLMYIGWGIAAFEISTPGSKESWQEHFTGKTIQKGTATALPVPATSLALDIYILIIPMLGIKSLQMDRRRKFGVAIIFLTGILAIVASTLRIVYTIPLVEEGGTADLTYHLMGVYTTIIAELCLGVIVTCMPTFAHTVRIKLPSIATLRSKLSSVGGKSTKASTENNTAYSSRHTKESTNASGKHNGFVRVLDLESGEANWEMVRYQPVKTQITAQKGSKMEGGKVHLEYEVKQVSHSRTQPYET